MSNTRNVILERLPPVTEQEVIDRFSSAVDIRDPRAFAVALQAFVDDRVSSVELPRPSSAPANDAMIRALARKASMLRASKRWAPRSTAIQRGREQLLEEFNQPHNLPLPEFARLANKSRQQIYKDIEARRLLALNVGPRRQKLPDWQLDPVKHRLTRAILDVADDVDTWTVYRALSEPLEGLRGLSPVEAVTADTVDDVAGAVLNVLGIH